MILESVHALESEAPVVSHFSRKLGGSSQSILAQASDGGSYVVKFPLSGNCSNILFNESVGTKLYMKFGLLCPPWKPLLLTDEFIDQHPDCWIENRSWKQRPLAGLCFGSRFIGDTGVRLREIVSNSWLARIYQPFNFWRAWFLDVCAEHFDPRQTLFQKGEDGLVYPWFIDHGYMFGGPENAKCFNVSAPRYLDPRVYGTLPLRRLKDFAEALGELDPDFFLDLLEDIPDQWKTERALTGFYRFIRRISDVQLRRRIVDEIVEAYRLFNGNRAASDPDWRQCPMSANCVSGEERDSEGAWPEKEGNVAIA